MSQVTDVYKHLRKGKTINWRQAYRLYGIEYLPARIHDIELQGVKVQREKRKVTKGNGEQTNITYYWIDKDDLKKLDVSDLHVI